MGVEPAYPSEKYGYIVPASRNGGAWRVARFKEKPREAEAKELLAEGGALELRRIRFQIGVPSRRYARLCGCALF